MTIIENNIVLVIEKKYKPFNLDGNFNNLGISLKEKFSIPNFEKILNII